MTPPVIPGYQSGPTRQNRNNFEHENYVEVTLLESHSRNVGRTKVFRGIPGSLFAFAAQLSFAIGGEGFIDEYKKRPDYLCEAEEAERILAALGIDAGDYGMPDAKSLLEHWHGCVAELVKDDVDGTDGTDVAKEDIEVGSGLPAEEQE